MDVCSNADILRVIYFISLIVDIVKIIIPIALIIYGLVDFSKSVINSDEKVQKKSVQLFFKRILYGILVFAVPWIVEVIMITLGDLLGKEGTANFTDCLDNANSACLDAMDSKDIDAIRNTCDVPEDYTIEEEDNNIDSDYNTDNDNNTEKYYCYVCNTGSNSQYKWSKTQPNDVCIAAEGWKKDSSIISSTYCLSQNGINNNTTGNTTQNNDKTNNDLVTSDKNITFSYKYEKYDNVLSYGLFTPSTASRNNKTPLIIWLHGNGERNIHGVSKDKFNNSGLPKILNNWKLDYFNAYVLCPHIISTNDVSWTSWDVQDNVYSLIDEIVRTKNVNTNKIILVGHSMGGLGVYDVAADRKDFYSALVIMSGYDTYKTEDGNLTDINMFKSIPVKGYVGSLKYGSDGKIADLSISEHEPSYKHMTKTFVNAFGSNSLTIYDDSHAMIPDLAFKEDKNNDNKSDLIEWMLSQ